MRTSKYFFCCLLFRGGGSVSTYVGGDRQEWGLIGTRAFGDALTLAFFRNIYF